jgi:hypothetical protein
MPEQPIQCAFCGGLTCLQVGPSLGQIRVTWYECFDCGRYTMRVNGTSQTPRTG